MISPSSNYSLEYYGSFLGSYADESAVPGSDLDIAVVYRDSDEEHINKISHFFLKITINRSKNFLLQFLLYRRVLLGNINSELDAKK